MEEIKVCPYCKEHDVVKNGKSYHCNSCDSDFTENDFIHEILRQKISCVCGGEEATEENPIDCTIGGEMLVIEGEAQGLSTLEMSRVVGLFQDYEGIVWVNIEAYNEPIEVDSLATSDLQAIFDWLEENYGNVVATDYFWAYYKK